MKYDADVIIVGAGPVGLMLANLLAACQVSVLVLEKTIQRQPGSKAIGITPVSLQILDRVQLAGQVIEQSVKVELVQIFGSRHKLGEVRLNELPAPYPYILSLPQERTEHLLEENLQKYACASVKRGREVYKLDYDDKQATVTVKAAGGDELYTGKVVCGCDGAHSTVRSLLGIAFRGRHYTDTFLMGNYRDETGWGGEARLYFTRLGSVEAFPLPGGERRWIIQTPSYRKHDQLPYLEKVVAARTGICLSAADRLSASAFQPQRYLASSFHQQTVILCGDASHTMSPIGGQGMNTGFGDADWLSHLLCCFFQGTISLNELMATYELYRKTAIRITADRSWLSMRIGTVKGPLASGARNLLVAGLVRSPLAKWLPLLYAGHTIPYRMVD
jgi:2-polyprenyl-6-methoxyphenol hydroxylase-like FAD-dependent oxidoreductase